MDTNQFLNDIRSVNWKDFNGPQYYNENRVVTALEALAAVSDEDTSGFVPIGMQTEPIVLNGRVYDDVLFAIGNNHAGTYYPAVYKAIGFIMQVALEGTNEISRNCAINILIDLYHICPEQNVMFPDEMYQIKDFVKKFILKNKENLIELSKRDPRNRKLILEFVHDYLD